MELVLLWARAIVTYAREGHCCLSAAVHVSQWPPGCTHVLRLANEISPSPLSLPLLQLQHRYDCKGDFLVPSPALDSKFTKTCLAFPDLLNNTCKQKDYWVTFLQHSSGALGRTQSGRPFVLSLTLLSGPPFPLVAQPHGSLNALLGYFSSLHPPQISSALHFSGKLTSPSLFRALF